MILILSVRVVPTRIIEISRETGNCTETVVPWTMNERDLKKSDIPEMIGMWFQNAVEINKVQAVLSIRLSFLPVIHFSLESVVEILEIHKILFWQGSSYYTIKDSVLP